MDQAFTCRVRQFVTGHALHSRFPMLEETASHFNMSPRTFARRLEREGASFCNLRGQVKVAIAKQLLEQSSLPIKCFLGQAGFTSRSAFSRAFQAATGQTPKEYRKRRQYISALDA